MTNSLPVFSGPICGSVRRRSEALGQQVPLDSRGKGRGIRPGRNELESVNRPVVIGGVLVCPGVVVVADGDGVVVVPRGRAEDVARVARQILNKGKDARTRLYDTPGMPSDRTPRQKTGSLPRGSRLIPTAPRNGQETAMKTSASRYSMTAVMVLLSCLHLSCFPRKDISMRARTEDQRTEQQKVVAEMRRVLDDELARWYPFGMDTAQGGFYSDINYRWELDGPQHKMIVTQARHVWSTSNAAMFYQKDDTLRRIAAHGVEFLKNTMWDKEFGGFYELVTRDGRVIPDKGAIVKRAYGNAFAIYALAAYTRASGDTTTMRMAQEAFRWLDQHGHDSRHGGYFQFLSREGTPFAKGWNGTPPKDQNSSIHLLEAFAELYRVWPDSVLRDRLQEMLVLVRDTITTVKGTMVLFFGEDWKPVSFRDSSPDVREQNYEFDHVSFAHDIETAYLMLEAADALGLEHDTTTLAAAKRMVDHTLDYGWDPDRGGIFDGGYYLSGQDRPAIVRRTKEWWGQVEACNSLLMMADLYPQDPHDYFQRFLDQWAYCKAYVIDQEFGGWFWGGTDIVPANRTSAKGSIWKGTYHTSRGLINCIGRLQRRLTPATARRHDPVNPEATPEARRLLDLLYSVSGEKIIAGHHNNRGYPSPYVRRVRELTGKTPQILGDDFIRITRPGAGDQIVRDAVDQYASGHIITLMWHAGRPQDDPPYGWKESIQGKLTDAEWKELTTPGTRLHSRWLKQVDEVAGYLKQLQSRGVPVLWRPYHELNGVWFWWGNRKGPEGSAKLYRMLFDRLTRDHRINNLIWVWNSNAPRQLLNDEAFAFEDFFPGLDCVDVLATDIYHRDYRQSHHDGLAELAQGKVISLGEVGEVPTPRILGQQPLWAWFMVWADFVDSHNTPREIKELYASPRTLAHEDMRKND